MWSALGLVGMTGLSCTLLDWFGDPMDKVADTIKELRRENQNIQVLIGDFYLARQPVPSRITEYPSFTVYGGDGLNAISQAIQFYISGELGNRGVPANPLGISPNATDRYRLYERIPVRIVPEQDTKILVVGEFSWDKRAGGAPDITLVMHVVKATGKTLTTEDTKTVHLRGDRVNYVITDNRDSVDGGTYRFYECRLASALSNDVEVAAWYRNANGDTVRSTWAFPTVVFMKLNTPFSRDITLTGGYRHCSIHPTRITENPGDPPSHTIFDVTCPHGVALEVLPVYNNHGLDNTVTAAVEEVVRNVVGCDDIVTNDPDAQRSFACSVSVTPSYRQTLVSIHPRRYDVSLSSTTWVRNTVTNATQMFTARGVMYSMDEDDLPRAEAGAVDRWKQDFVGKFPRGVCSRCSPGS